MQASDNAFWRFSLRVYASPGVGAECVALQDSHGLDVNLLLYCAWRGANGVLMGEAELEAAVAAVAQWHDEAVRPLRSVRRALKADADPDAQALRNRVKAMELEAERIEQDRLFADASESATAMELGAASAAVPANVALYLQRYGEAAANQKAGALIDAAVHAASA